MAKQDQFPQIFEQLKTLLQPLVPPLKVGEDTPMSYLVLGSPTAKYPAGQAVGAVRLGKAYVSYHLMPVYMFPALLDDLPEPLKKRMQGKSCFKFSQPLTEPLLAEFAALTTRSIEQVRQAQKG